MSFESAVSLNRIAHGERSGFDLSGRSKGGAWSDESGGARQRVNISQDTMMRAARLKLSRAMHQKVAYDRHGAFTPTEEAVGRFLSAKA